MILTPAAADALDLGVRDGDLARLTGATVAVSSEVAGSRGAETGQRVRLVLGDGARVDARVVAVYDRGLGFGPVVLSHDLAKGGQCHQGHTRAVGAGAARPAGGDATAPALTHTHQNAVVLR
ncbi:hypothetical protein ACH40E_07110 [Streptomyces acidicola]|uniref:hypothetical protein n=1 Tax=Streptomyces acidicola TaxID=2596892 RepID=UPI0037A6AD1C